MAYKILFFERWCYNLKEIGEKLKEARDNIGISIEEASEDLKVLPTQIEAIEAGDMDKFKDVFSVKYFIRDYAKYLGLSYEDVVDEFNEYLFDYTSKLSLDDIKKAKKKTKEDEPRVSSPYTLEPKEPKRIPTVVFAILFIILIITIMFFVVKNIDDNNKNEDQIIALVD